jgi:hypothetical protein
MTRLCDNEEVLGALQTVADRHGCCGLKLGTEVEHCDFWEVEQVVQLAARARPALPVTVKIGGPEARNDLDTVLTLGADVVVAPKVESIHSLRMFVGAAVEVAEQLGRAVVMGVNIETVTAVGLVGQLLASPEGRRLAQVSVGRVDLSTSGGLALRGDGTMLLTRRVVDAASAAGKTTCVGGAMTPAEGRRVIREVAPHRINTRFVYLASDAMHDVGAAVQAALEFEITLARALAAEHTERGHVYQARIRKAERNLADS